MTTTPITQQIEYFALGAVVIIALGSFSVTHDVAVFLIAFAAIALLLHYLGGSNA
jgi:hypothetical protein